MFKKKKSELELPRGRSRIAEPLPRNTAVFSYHANRSTNNLESRERTALDAAQPKPKRMPRFGLQYLNARRLLSSIVILVVFLLSVGLSSHPKIVILGDSSNTFALQNPKIYAQAAHQLLGGSFSSNNKLTINTAAVALQLQHQFPELHTVSISLPFLGRQPTLYIQPAIPQLVLATQTSGQFILDSNGRALTDYTPATNVPSDRAVPIITDQSGLTFKKGDIVLSSQNVAFITEVAAQFQAKGIKVDTWTLPSGGSQLSAKISGTPYSVKFNLQSNAREEAGTFFAVKQRLDAEHTVPQEYIDVRVTGRAYYK